MVSALVEDLNVTGKDSKSAECKISAYDLNKKLGTLASSLSLMILGHEVKMKHVSGMFVPMSLTDREIAASTRHRLYDFKEERERSFHLMLPLAERFSSAADYLESLISRSHHNRHITSLHRILDIDERMTSNSPMAIFLCNRGFVAPAQSFNTDCVDP